MPQTLRVCVYPGGVGLEFVKKENTDRNKWLVMSQRVHTDILVFTSKQHNSHTVAVRVAVQSNAEWGEHGITDPLTVRGSAVTRVSYIPLCILSYTKLI